MSGRGRGRTPRSVQEPVAGAGRRSARHQQQPQQQPQQQQEQQQQQQQQQQNQETNDAQRPQQPQGGQDQGQVQVQAQLQAEAQASVQQKQPEAPMFAPGYQDIDPAIRGPQDASMPPPQLPIAKSVRGVIARRGTRRGELEDIASIRSRAATDAPATSEPPSTLADPDAFSQHSGAAPPPSSSMADETEGRKSVRERLMNKMLPRLFTASVDYFTHLCSDERTVDSEIWGIERRALQEAFQSYLSQYLLRIGDPVVDPHFVVNTLQLEPGSFNWRRVSGIMLGANLTRLLDDLTSMGEEDDTLALLQVWDSWFLNAFASDSPGIWNKEMKETMVEQILMIRTQLSIFTLEKLKRDSTEPFHPYEKVARIWCEGNVSVEAVESFLANDRETLQLRLVMQPYSEVDILARERAATRFTSICRLLPDQVVEGRALDLHGIREEYPFGDFEGNLRVFIKDCFLKTRALHQGVVSSELVAWPVSSADPALRMGSQLDTQAMAHHYTQAGPGAPPLSFNVESIRLMKQMEPPSTVGYHGLSPSSSYQITEPPTNYSPGPKIPFPPSSPSATSGFTDAHIHAGYRGQAASYAASASQVAGKKRRSRGGAAASRDGAPAKRQRAGRRRGVSEANMALASAGAASVAPSVAPSQYPPVPGEEDDLPDFEALAHRSREVSAKARALNSKPREPQVRAAWVRKDVALLVRAVNTYQCKWSIIEKEIKAGTIPFERPRDQQALRDKARLLKQDFLKVDAVLPRGFDLVVLGKKEREAVKACGKNPDRREADVDAEGRPVNTELVPEGSEQETQPEPQLSVQPGPQPAIQAAPHTAVQPPPHPAAQPAPQPTVQPAPQPSVPEPTMA